MFRSVFKPYGVVWNLLNHVTDVLFLSLLWCFCSLPLITVGAASTALYDAAVHGVRYGETGLYRRFFRTFKSELKTSLGVTTLWGAVLVFGSYVLALLADNGTTAAGLMVGGYQALLLLPLGAACWSVTILSRFTYRFGALTRTALQFLPAHLLSSAAIAVLVRLCIWFCAENPLALTFVPALCALGVSVFAEPVFAKYGGSLEKQASPEEA